MSDSTRTARVSDTTIEGLATSDAGAPDSIHLIADSGLLLNPEQVRRYVLSYSANPIYAGTEGWLIRDNPYRRPLDQKNIPQFDFTRRLTYDEVFSASALSAQRMLFNIYETDLIFLPEKEFAAKKEDYARFYSNENKLIGEMIRPTLEAHVFSVLEDEIDVSGGWTLEALGVYMQRLVETHEQTELDIVTAILSSRNPEKAARALMIQVASDFLSESSASARNVLGKFGTMQSGLFKIAIDDYGFGVHSAKHSTLFENTLETCNLLTDVHAYWYLYLGGTLALNNYYHYVSRDHSKFFRAIGAIAIAEALFSHTCHKISEMLRTVLGKDVDTYYFDEHFHIDAHHGRMAFEGVVTPAIEKYGDSVIPEIVRGMEELRIVTAIADEDFIAQVKWCDELEKSKEAASSIIRHISVNDDSANKTTLIARRHDTLTTRTQDSDFLCVVESGSLNVIAGYEQSIILEAGEGIIIPRYRLHGVESMTGESVYHLYKLKEGALC